ncbi:MAG: carbohydrate ABC transporter permease [Oscillospiraceae bacterium]
MPMSIDVVGQSDDKTKLLIRRIIAYVVLIALVFLSLFPFYLLIINATRGKVQTGIEWIPSDQLSANLRMLFSGSVKVAYGNVFKALLNSLIISASTAALSIYFSALTAYAIHVYDFRLKKFAFTFILVIMMVPTQASAIGFYRLMKDWGLTNSYIPLIVPSIAAPAVFYFMKQYMDSSLPLEIVEAARIDGCGEFRTFNSIVLPILKPAFAVQAIFTFVTNWNNYFMPRLILDDKAKYTVPLVLSGMRNAGPLEQHAGLFNLYIVIAILPVVIVYLCLSKFIIRGVALGSVKG